MVRVINNISGKLVKEFTKITDATEFISEKGLASTCGIMPDATLTLKDINWEDTLLRNQK
jgi:hypothetical protein